MTLSVPCAKVPDRIVGRKRRDDVDVFIVRIEGRRRPVEQIVEEGRGVARELRESSS